MLILSSYNLLFYANMALSTSDDFYKGLIKFEYEIPAGSLNAGEKFFDSKTVQVGGFPWYRF